MSFWDTFKSCKKSVLEWFSDTTKEKEQTSAPIPAEFTPSEKIVRAIYSPINFKKNSDELQNNAYRPPADSDEISVNRLDFTNESFCKRLAKKSENPKSKRTYWGFACHQKIQIDSSNAHVVYSPILDKNPQNPYHADIKIGYVVIKNQQLPAHINKMINDLAKSARTFKDSKPEHPEWNEGAIL